MLPFSAHVCPLCHEEIRIRGRNERDGTSPARRRQERTARHDAQGPGARGIRGGRSGGWHGRDSEGARTQVFAGDYGFENARGVGAGRSAGNEAGRRYDPRVAANRVRFRGRSRCSDERRSLRFSSKAGRPGSFEASGEARSGAARDAARKSAAEGGVRGALGISAHRGGKHFHQRGEPADPKSCGHRHNLPFARRKRHWERTVRPSDSSLVAATGDAIRGPELRGDPGRVGRERTVWPRERRVHGSSYPQSGENGFGAQGNTFPRRNWRITAGDSGQVVARAGGKAVRTRGRLLHYRWPGNVSEQQNTMERAVILADGMSIRAEALQLPSTKPDMAKLPGGMLPEKFNWEGSLEQVTSRATEYVEKALLENTMSECKWNKTRAAEKLGITPKTLLAKLRAAGLEE